MKCPNCNFDNSADTVFCGKCGTPLLSGEEMPSSSTRTLVVPRQELTTGTIFAGRYQIIKELGKGGMGRVYKALDKEINDEVAIKLLKPEIAADEQTIERFRNELKIARKVTHKNVCRMHDIGKEEETYYISMEYVEGEELKRLIKRKGRLSEEEAIQIAKQVCDGLTEAHELGVIHRDLKPQNIMIDRSSRAKIMDFGIARSVEAPGMTMTGTIIGTPDYLSPEQAEGEEADQRSDIYSLGVILYEMLTGSVPFKGDTALSVAVKHKTEIPEDIRKINPEVSEDLNWMILKCMEKDREQRFQSANELYSALECIERGLPLEKVPPKGIRLFFKSFLFKLRERKIIQTLAAFIGGGFLILEFVHWILIDHYHFPERILDITFITLLCALLCVLTWQWFRSKRKRRRLKPELVLIPLFILLTAFLDTRLFMQIGEPGKETVSETRWQNSIAVLPFANLSADEEREYFCDGLTEELINALSHVRDLKVVARTSAFAFKGKELDVREIGGRLNVAKVLEGSVRTAGNQMRVTAQLINVSDGYHIWSEKWDCKIDDVFSVQDEISLAVVDKLKLELLGEEKERVFKRHTQDLEAYHLYLKGIYFWNKRSLESMRKGMACFQQAIDKDPTYALAYVGLADSFNMLGFYWFIPPNDSLPKARALAEQALRIDNDLAEAHASVAWNHFIYDWNWPAAERGFKRAIELNPAYAMAHSWYAIFLMTMERFDEALTEVKRAQELDPLTPIIGSNLGMILLYQHHYDKAIEQLQKTLEMDPAFSIAYYNLGKAFAMKKQYDKALEAFQKTKDLGLFWGAGFLGYVHALLGDNDKAMKQLHELEEMSKSRHVPPMSIAFVYHGLGDMDKAFEFYEKAHEEHDSGIPFFKVCPMIENARSDPRFKALLKRLNLE